MDAVTSALYSMEQELRNIGSARVNFAPYVKQQTVAKLWNELSCEERSDYQERAKNWGMKKGEDNVTRKM